MATVYEERQKFRQRWLWALVIPTSALPIALMAHGLHQQLVLGKPFGNNPVSDDRLIGLAILVTGLVLAAPALLLLARLDVTVAADEILILFRPFHLRGKRIALGSVVEATARRYKPLQEYGGWGIRYGGRNGRAYNVSGDEGVQLVLEDGSRILIGSQRSAELERAIRSGMGRSTAGGTAGVRM